MSKLTKEKRDKLLLVGLGFAAVLVALDLFVISAQQTALQSAAQSADATKEKLAKAERWLRMGRSVETRLNAARKELAVRQEQMAPMDKFKWFYNTVEKCLAQHHVKLVDITKEPEVGEVWLLPKFPYQAATFGVKMTALYHDFGSFLVDFENQFPYMRVQNLELETESGAAKALAKGAEAHPLPGKSAPASDGKVEPVASASEELAITMRVVTLIKPNLPL